MLMLRNLVQEKRGNPLAGTYVVSHNIEAAALMVCLGDAWKLGRPRSLKYSPVQPLMKRGEHPYLSTDTLNLGAQIQYLSTLIFTSYQQRDLKVQDSDSNHYSDCTLLN